MSHTELSWNQTISSSRLKSPSKAETMRSSVWKQELLKSKKSLNKLKKADIDEVKSLGKPPHGVKLTAAAVCIMFRVKPDKVKDPDGGMKKVNDFFTPAKNYHSD